MRAPLVIDGNYSAARNLVWMRADTVIWFDLPRRTVIRQIVLRTMRRTVTRATLWNGNREPITGLFRLDPDKSIIGRATRADAPRDSALAGSPRPWRRC
jgi:hypothetical protein